MNDPLDNWKWFGDDEARKTAPSKFDTEQIANIAARLFQSTEGQYLIDFLRAITIERTLGPDAPGAQLRHLEGQRQLIATLTNLINRGANPGR
jgi:hypothetical protein